MLDPTLQLRWTLAVDATDRDLAFVLHHFAAADWTRVGHAKFFFLSGARVRFHFNDGRNHFTGLLDHDRIPDANVFTFDLIFVMQGRATDRASADEDRFEHRDRR